MRRKSLWLEQLNPNIMNLKIGDKVRIKSIDWYEIMRDWCGEINIGPNFTTGMSYYCGKEATITYINLVGTRFRLNIDSGEFAWCLDFFEDGKI